MENSGVQSEIDLIRSIRLQIRIWRAGLVILLAVVVFISVAQIWSAINGLAQEGSRREQFVQGFGSSMKEKILPQLQDVGSQAVKSIDFNKEFGQLNKQAPVVADKALKELRLLASNIPNNGRKLVAREFEEVLQGRADTLKKEFPDVDEEQVRGLLASLTTETQAQVSDITDELFSPHIDTMNEIIADMQAIKKVEGAAAQGEVPTVQMGFLIADILRADMAEMNPDAEAPAAGKGKK